MIDVTPERAEIFDTNTFETRMSQREYRRIGSMTTRIDNAWGGGFQEAVTTMYVDDKTGLFVADIEAFEKWIVWRLMSVDEQIEASAARAAHRALKPLVGRLDWAEDDAAIGGHAARISRAVLAAASGVKRNQILKDSEGNHFRVVKSPGDLVEVESVATKEVFYLSLTELFETDREVSLMSVEDWARREAENRWPVNRDIFGILSREEAAMNAIQRGAFEEGAGLAFSALLSDEAVLAGVIALREMGPDTLAKEPADDWEIAQARAALQAAVDAVTKGDTE